jgi:hypothetical protein
MVSTSRGACENVVGEDDDQLWQIIFVKLRRLNVELFMDERDIRFSHNQCPLGLLLLAQVFIILHPVQEPSRRLCQHLTSYADTEYFRVESLPEVQPAERSSVLGFFYGCESPIIVDAVFQDTVPVSHAVMRGAPQKSAIVIDQEFHRASARSPESSCFGLATSIVNLFSVNPVLISKNSTVAENNINSSSWASFFDYHDPSDVAEGLSRAEYNFVKGTVGAPILMAMAPLTTACSLSTTTEKSVEEAMDDSRQPSGSYFTATCVTRGIARSVIGGPSLFMGGVISATNQLYYGLANGEVAPGTGTTLTEKYHHIHHHGCFSLASNAEPQGFDDLIDQLVEAGKLPAHQYDADGTEVPYTYQFFKSTSPASALEGFHHAEFNICKGIIVGGTLIVSSPLTHALQNSGWDGLSAGVGFVTGVLKGTFGGAVLITAGCLHGTRQQIRGILTPRNYSASVAALKSVFDDLRLLATEPVIQLLLPSPFQTLSAYECQDDCIFA